MKKLLGPSTIAVMAGLLVACAVGSDEAAPLTPARTEDVNARSTPLPWVPSRVDWTFGAVTDRAAFDVDIANDPGERVGLYAIVLKGKIDGTPFYFGVQTDVYTNEKGGWVGKGLIFSRWKTHDINDAIAAPGGYARAVGGDDPYVGVRLKYAWAKGRYVIRLERESGDEAGDWFGVSIEPVADDARATSIGRLRFPRATAGVPATIGTEGSSSMMVYRGVKSAADVPAWAVEIVPAREANAKGVAAAPPKGKIFDELVSDVALHDGTSARLSVGGAR